MKRKRSHFRIEPRKWLFPTAIISGLTFYGMWALSGSIATAVSQVLFLATLSVFATFGMASVLKPLKRKQNQGPYAALVIISLFGVVMFVISYLLVMFISGSFIFGILVWQRMPSLAIILIIVYPWLLWQLSIFERFIEKHYSKSGINKVIPTVPLK